MIFSNTTQLMLLFKPNWEVTKGFFLKTVDVLLTEHQSELTYYLLMRIKWLLKLNTSAVMWE